MFWFWVFVFFIIPFFHGLAFFGDVMFNLFKYNISYTLIFLEYINTYIKPKSLVAVSLFQARSCAYLIILWLCLGY